MVTVNQELARAVRLAVKMMKEAYPDTEHDDMPEDAKAFDSFIGSEMGDDAYKVINAEVKL